MNGSKSHTHVWEEMATDERREMCHCGATRTVGGMITEPAEPKDTRFAFLEHLNPILNEDVIGLKKAAEQYGDSWKRRGGVGAFMMLARKWDRLEKQVEKHGWDVFKAVEADRRDEGLLDDIADLRRYLHLVSAEMAARGIKQKHRDNKA